MRAILELLASPIGVHGLAHITGGGLDNLLRLNDDVGFAIDAPLPVPPIFGLIARCGAVAEDEMWEVFNMGCGFVAVVAADDAEAAVAILARHHPGSARIGSDHRPRRADRAGSVDATSACETPDRVGVGVPRPRTTAQ